MSFMIVRCRRDVNKKLVNLEFDNRELTKEVNFTKRFSEELFNYIKSIEKERVQTENKINKMTMM